MKTGGIILAGGKGERFQGKKQFYELDGKPLWRHVYDKLTISVDPQNIVIVGVNMKGGCTRSESVIIGLDALDIDTDRVIILEAARPLVTEAQINILLQDAHESAAFVTPLVNTVLFRDGRYINREDLYELLTPQAFNYQKLIKAYHTEKYINMTDETRVMFEEYGLKAHLIETGQNLVKMTYQRDITIIETLYKNGGIRL